MESGGRDERRASRGRDGATPVNVELPVSRRTGSTLTTVCVLNVDPLVRGATGSTFDPHGWLPHLPYPAAVDAPGDRDAEGHPLSGGPGAAGAAGP